MYKNDKKWYLANKVKYNIIMKNRIQKDKLIKKD